MTFPAIRILDAPRCHLGEGPCYVPSTDTAWWVDILERRLFEAPLGGGPARMHALPFMASDVSVIDDAHLLLAAEDGLYVRTVADGRLTRLCGLEADDARTRSNDGRVHPSGAYWISTMGREAQGGLGTIHHVAAGRVTRLFGGLTIPNAIAFSPDGAVGYFACTEEGLLKRVALDPATGLPRAEPSVLTDQSSAASGLDGAVVDADGLIWCARWGGARLDAYDPSGTHVRSVAVPASRPSCPTFAGPDAGRLLLTSAAEGMDEAEKAADPHHGRTFLLDLGVRGLLEPRARP